MAVRRITVEQPTQTTEGDLARVQALCFCSRCVTDLSS